MKPILFNLGDLTSPPVLLSIIRSTGNGHFMTLNVYGSIFIGMILTGIVALFTGQLKFTGGLWKVPHFTRRHSCLESYSTH